MDKKGFELSINMLVVIILSLAILGMGYMIFNTILTQANELNLKMSDNAKEQLFKALDDGSTIFIPEKDITVNRGDPAIFSISFWNELDKTYTFKVSLTKNDPTYSGTIEMLTYDFTLKPNEKAAAKIGVTVPKDTPKGQYGFDVKITYHDTNVISSSFSFVDYDKPQRIYVYVN